MNTITPKLMEVSNLPINKFYIDNTNEKIKLSLTDKSNSIKEIIFNDVKSYYFLNKDENFDIFNHLDMENKFYFNLNPNEKNESKYKNLNNIMYCKEDYYIENHEDMMFVRPNFIVELNDSNIFIIANSINIDNEVYNV